MTSKNSENSPLHIAEVRLEQGEGSLGLTLCPGKKDVGRNWNRDLGTDLQAIRAWGATTVVTLIEDHEFRLLRIESLADEVRALGMNWIHLPIVDVRIPDSRFEDAWVSDGPKLHDRLDAGEKILIHCRGGLGRTGLVAGRILVERGCAPKNAIQRIRSVRPHAIETSEQERYVMKSKLVPDRDTQRKNAVGSQPPLDTSTSVTIGASI
jgi:protein-tyrosine phosphatase